ncbi:Hsp20/alpha crystallin family protein [bacterium]|nr:Hsp20/alpha crystallin family protein [bacterium]
MSFWKMFQELEELRHEMSEAVKDMGLEKFPKSAFLPGISARRFPMVNISDDQDSVIVEALVPGLDPASLQVSVIRNTLTLSGEKARSKITEDAYHRYERGAGKFSRTIELPVEVDPDKVSAEYKNGILTITLPKTESSRPRSIKVQVN